METISKQEVITVSSSEVKIENGILYFTFKKKPFTVQLKSLTSVLEKATTKQLADYTLSPSGYGIHWNLLDEDISFAGIIKNDGKPTVLNEPKVQYGKLKKKK